MSKRGSVLRVNTKSDKVKKMGKREYPYHGCVIKKREYAYQSGALAGPTACCSLRTSMSGAGAWRETARPRARVVVCELETRGTATIAPHTYPLTKRTPKAIDTRSHETVQSARGLDPKVCADAKRTKPEHRAERGVDVTLHVQVPAEV